MASKSLLKDKGFMALAVTQFFGAFNDNAFKMIITLLALNLFMDEGTASRYVSIASLIFVVPFLLFSTYAGSLADRVSKRTVSIGVKIMEIVVMAAGVWALSTKNMNALLGLLFFMALQSTFFSPAKYGMLPEILEDKDLSNGNGIINMMTFIAIILGTAAGGLLLKITKPDIYLSGWVFVGIAVLGTFSSLGISKVPAAAPNTSLEWNPLKTLTNSLKEIRKDRTLLLSMLGIGYFWFLGAVLLIILPLYGKILLNADEGQITWIMTVLSLGIGTGSVIAGKVSGDKVELGLVPLGSLGLGLFSLDLAFAYGSWWRALIDLFLAGVFAGIFVIPLNALFQSKSPKEKKGMMIGTLNVVSFIGIAIASLIVLVFTDDKALGLSINMTLALVALASLGVTIYIIMLLPQSFVRLLLWVLTHTIYKIKVVGRENFPTKGPALLVCNHLSYVDPLLVSSSVSRNVQFFMFRKFYEWKGLNWFFRTVKAIPISATDGAKKFAASMQEARQALRDGHIVCIFAEGAISRVAQTLGFKKGLEIIAKDLDIPIIPIHLDRVWGSIFSFRGNGFIWKIPRQIPYPVTVSFGKALPGNSKVHQVRQAVLDLGSEAFRLRNESLLPLHQAFFRAAKRQWLSDCLSDTTGISLKYGQVSAASTALARVFNQDFKDDQYVGILLPPSVGGALVNIGLLAGGKIPVNLNYTLTKEILNKILDKAGIKKIITSKKVLEALKWEVDEKHVFVEDLLKKAPKWKISIYWVLLKFLPQRLIEKTILCFSQAQLNDPATVIFTSGSTGLPKGVVLSHANLQANTQGLLEIFQLDNSDKIAGVLPFFHSFGYTATIWFPLLGGFSVVYHRSPLESGAVARMVREHKATVLLGTPTFLQMWMKKFKKEDLKTLKFAMVGAEKLQDWLAKKFLDDYGVPVLEGYGATELSPVACANVLNVEDRGETQLGHKDGKVGRPLPGVSVKILDPESGNLQPPESPGNLWVKGPNVMKGYLNESEKTAQVLTDGWYNTGDIAMIDEDGFIKITDRASRFSKIGGEMVPHGLVEERLNELCGEEEAKFFISSIPDEKKGEALVVLYFSLSGSLDDLYNKLKGSDLPKLWIPERKLFFKVDEWPVLATGKLDLAKAKDLVKAFAASPLQIR